MAGRCKDGVGGRGREGRLGPDPLGGGRSGPGELVADFDMAVTHESQVQGAPWVNGSSTGNVLKNSGDIFWGSVQKGVEQEIGHRFSA